MRKRLATTSPPPRYSSLKVNAVMFAEFKKDEEYQVKNFKTSNEIITPATNLMNFTKKLSRIYSTKWKSSKYVAVSGS